MPSPSLLPVSYPVHPSQYQGFTTEQRRAHFLLTDFQKEKALNLTYTHYDSISAGAVIPFNSEIPLANYINLKSDYFKLKSPNRLKYILACQHHLD